MHHYHVRVIIDELIFEAIEKNTPRAVLSSDDSKNMVKKLFRFHVFQKLISIVSGVLGCLKGCLEDLKFILEKSEPIEIHSKQFFEKKFFLHFGRFLKFWYSWIVSKVSLPEIGTRTLTQSIFLKKPPLKLIQSASEREGDGLSNALWFIFMPHIEKILSQFFMRGYLNFYPSWYYRLRMRKEWTYADQWTEQAFRVWISPKYYIILFLRHKSLISFDTMIVIGITILVSHLKSTVSHLA